MGFILNKLQNFKKFGIIKVGKICLKLIDQYGVQTYFFITKFNEIYMHEVIA
jgi:hypothetical protein